MDARPMSGVPAAAVVHRGPSVRVTRGKETVEVPVAPMPRIVPVGPMGVF
jgi:pilus assembly protein CpaB